MLIHKMVIQFVYAGFLKSFTAHHSCPVSVLDVEVSHHKVSVSMFCRTLLGYYAEGMHANFKENLI